MPEEELTKADKKILSNPEFRKQVGENSLYLFSHIYFGDYFKHQTPAFHKKIYNALESNEDFVELLAFRYSGKSTLAALFYPIWEAVNDKYHFILLATETGTQVKQLFQNIQMELEQNELLIKDFGPFEGQEEWTTKSMILPEYNTKIMGRSVGQSSRGLRFREDRPELAVFDDLESDDSVRTQEKRDKTENWFKGVMMPALDENKKVILSGSLLHQDCLMRRIEQEIVNNKRDGKLLKFSFFEDGEPQWKTKFDTPERIQKEKRLVGKESMWQREYLLNIVPEEGQIVKYEDIKWYEKIPERAVDKRRVIAVDLAISEAETADYTAITVFKLMLVDGNVKIYCEDYLNKRTGFKDTIINIDGMHTKYPDSVVLIEDKSYQRAAIETLENESYPVKPISFKGDKRSRLETVSPLIKKGLVYFKESQREIVEQMVNLGTEKHDDLCDSAVYALYDLQRHLNNTSFPTKDEEDVKPITSGLLNKSF